MDSCQGPTEFWCSTKAIVLILYKEWREPCFFLYLAGIACLIVLSAHLSNLPCFCLATSNARNMSAGCMVQLSTVRGSLLRFREYQSREAGVASDLLLAGNPT